MHNCDAFSQSVEPEMFPWERLTQELPRAGLLFWEAGGGHSSSK